MNPYRINIKKITPRHITAKPLKTKDKEKILKAARKKKSHFLYGGTKVEMITAFLSEIIEARDNEMTSLKC